MSWFTKSILNKHLVVPKPKSDLIMISTEDMHLAATDLPDLPDIVNALAASPNFARDGICFAAQNSGLYRSEDGGGTWQPAYTSLQLDGPLATTAVAVSPDFNADRYVIAGVEGGLLRSHDGGTTWLAALLAPPPPLVTALVVSPNFAADGVVFAGTMEDGVFRSADRGSSWAAWNFGLLDLQVLSLAISPTFAADETLFAGTASGLFRSTNGGRAWRDVDFPTEYAPVLSLALSPDYAHDGRIFIGTESNGLFSSDDDGLTWTRCGEDVITDAVNGLALAQEQDAGMVILALLDSALLVSRDGGVSWLDWKPGLSCELGIASLAAPQGIDPAAPLLVGLVEGGVIRL